MSDDAIKKALEVAGSAVGRVQGYVDENTTDVATAAIAAFLEALPPGWHMDKPRDEIAAAIRRAGGAA